MAQQRLGVFGGSFDPVHRGHLALAEACRQQARLDRVLFVPAASQPLKPAGPRASEADRAAMLRLAIAEDPALQLCTLELQRGGVSYTVDTLRELREQHPGEELFFLMGADVLTEIAQWRQPQAILELATPLVVRRPGQQPHATVASRRGGEIDPRLQALRPFCSEQRLAEIAQLLVEMPPTPISSSEIRRRIAAGEAWDLLTTPAVAAYIREHGLYRD